MTHYDPIFQPGHGNVRIVTDENCYTTLEPVPPRERTDAMRIASKIDRNQPELVQAFRQMGARVQVLSMVGKGFPDLLICVRGKLALVELKDGARPPSKRKLTPDEEAWHAEWEGAPVFIVSTLDEAEWLVNNLELYT